MDDTFSLRDTGQLLNISENDLTHLFDASLRTSEVGREIIQFGDAKHCILNNAITDGVRNWFVFI